MSETLHAIFENGVFRPLKPVNLRENQVVEIDVRDLPEEISDKNKWLAAFDQFLSELNPNTPSLSDQQISRESMYEEQLIRQL